MPEKKGTSRKTSTARRGSQASGYECGVCGYRVLVDKDCGCAEEHVLMCCDEPMGRTTAGSRASARTPSRSAGRTASSRTGGARKATSSSRTSSRGTAKKR